MSWLVFLVRPGVPTWLGVDRSSPSARTRCARWWSGRAMVSSVFHFCLALCVVAVVAMSLLPHSR